jgi:hypothetical protein
MGGLAAGFPRCAKCRTTMQVGAARCYFCGTSVRPAERAPASQPVAEPVLTVSSDRAPADFLGGLLAGASIVLVPLALRIVAG